MRISLILVLITLLSLAVSAQNRLNEQFLTMDYQLVVDNDVFTLKLKQDQYYTSGIFPAVRLMLDSIGDTKVIRTYQLNHRIYTPRKVTWRRDFQLDRPYAGIISVTGGNEYYFASNHYLKVQLELGWVGPATKVDETQITYHRWFSMPTPRGWKYQISNSPVVNAYASFIKPIYSSYNFELSSISNVSLGTIYNNVQQELMVRIGELKPMFQSAYSGSAIGSRKMHNIEPVVQEIYFFYSPGIEHVIYNATLQGNLIGKEAPFTVDAIKWIWQHRFGVMLSFPKFDIGFIAYRRTRENSKARDHSYVGLRLNQRF